MEREIRLSVRAKNKLTNLLAFLETEWSVKVRKDFVHKLDDCLKKIQTLPDSFPESEAVKGLRKCVITKQTTLYYKYSDSTIDIVTFFDTRQNPGLLSKEIKGQRD
jgi:plasmid stabilization system protein ParE